MPPSSTTPADPSSPFPRRDTPAPDRRLGEPIPDPRLVEPVESGSGLEIGLQLTSDSTVMWVRGEIDMLTLPRLSAELSARLRDGSMNLVLDLQDVTFLSGAGLSVLLLAADRAREAGITLRTWPSRAVSQVAHLLGLTAGLNLVGDR
jgi:anti-anti-sigma factor